MSSYDELLKALQEKIARFRQLSAVLQESYRQRSIPISCQMKASCEKGDYYGK